MLGDTSIPIEVRTDWVWAQVARLHPEVRRENFVGAANDPYQIHGIMVDNICGYIPQPRHRVMDIGANVGVFSVFCAIKGACVVAYEPNPVAYAQMGQVISQNRVNALVQTFNRAVWRETGESDFWSWPTRTIISTLSAHRAARAESLKDPGTRTKISTIAFADAIGQLEWDCVKVDIEGGEFDLFPSISDSALSRVKFLTMELHNDAADKARYDALVSRLAERFFLSGIKDGSPEYVGEDRWISVYGTRR